MTMESKLLGRNLDGKQFHELSERSSFFVVAGLCFVALSGAARAQTCPTGNCAGNSALCNDGQFCTIDVCIGSSCLCFENSCDDSLFCTDDSCNEGADQCVHTAHACQAPTPQCSETLDACVQCLNAGQCTTPPRLRCNSSGTCVQCTSSDQCQDTSYCNGFESCNLSTGLCQAGTPVTCQKKCFMGPTPGANCSTDGNCGTGGKCLGYCNETRAACVQCKVDANCDDGKFCNGAETCVNDQCVVGTAPVCKKCVGGLQQLQPCSTNADCGNPPGPGTCTGGPSYCDEASNQCVQCLNPSQCDDLNFCTSNACVFNACVFSPKLAICSDGAFCNGDEVCTYVLGNPCSIFNDRAHCCSDGPDPVCVDNFSCTVDICNETIDDCQNTPNNALCPGSNLACNGTEICNPVAPGADPASGCVAGTPMDCSAFETDCSTGACVESPPPAHCQPSPINQGASCNDNSPCTALSKCNNGSCVDNPPTTTPPDPWRCVRLEWRASGPTTVLAGSTVQLGLYAVAIGCNTLHESNKRCIGGAAANSTCTTDANCRVCVGGTAPPGTECTTNAPCSGGGACSAPAPCTDLCPSTSLPVSSIDALFSWNKTFLQLNPSTGPDPNPQDACVSPTACTACPPNTYNWGATGGFSGWVNDCTGDALNAPCAGGVPSLNDGNARYLGFRGVNQICPDGCATTAGLLVSTIKFKAISGGTSSIALLPCFGTGSKTAVISPVVFQDIVTSDVTKSLGSAISITVTCDSVDDCNDNNPCTNDSCTCNTPSCGGSCVHANNTNSCNDGLFCTTNDRCSSGQCVGDATTCKKCVGAPNAGESCSVNAQCTPGTCTGAPSICQETNDRCVECSSAANCNDGQGNTVDTCVKTCSGGTNINDVCTVIGDCPGPGGACESDFCEHTPIDCNDNVACTVDVSDPVDGHCTNTPNHAYCNPLNSFCSAAICDPVDGCILDHECISLDGNPCPDPATCNETTNTCGGCKQPTMVTAGPRYLAVTPLDQGSTPVALVVTGDCGDPIAACVYRYVQSKCLGGTNNGQNCNTDTDCPKRCVGGQFPNAVCTIPTDCPQGECVGKCDAGTLGATAFYKTTAQWGTAKLRGAQIRPETTYMVHAECNFPGGAVLSSAASAKTWKWGDDDNNGTANVADVANLVNAFKGFYGPFTFEQMNLWGSSLSAPCTPDAVLNALDVAVCVDALRGFAFPCSITCP